MKRTSFNELRSEIDANPERRASVDEIKRAMQDAVRLSRLREAQGASQEDVAAELCISQGRVSQIEHAGDLYLSTLSGYVSALGGRLEVAAVFPNEERVIIAFPSPA